MSMRLSSLVAYICMWFLLVLCTVRSREKWTLRKLPLKRKVFLPMPLESIWASRWADFHQNWPDHPEYVRVRAKSHSMKFSTATQKKHFAITFSTLCHVTLALQTWIQWKKIETWPAFWKVSTRRRSNGLQTHGKSSVLRRPLTVDISALCRD